MLLICIFGISDAQEKSEKFPVLKGPYLGQKPPGLTPEVFAPGIISKAGFHLHSSLAFSPDGRKVYFTKFIPEPEVQSTIYLRFCGCGPSWMFFSSRHLISPSLSFIDNDVGDAGLYPVVGGPDLQEGFFAFTCDRIVITNGPTSSRRRFTEDSFAIFFPYQTVQGLINGRERPPVSGIMIDFLPDTDSERPFFQLKDCGQDDFFRP